MYFIIHTDFCIGCLANSSCIILNLEIMKHIKLFLLAVSYVKVCLTNMFDNATNNIFRFNL